MTGAFLFPDDAPAGDAVRPTYGGGLFDRHVTRWNDNCVFCHNVAPNPGRDPATGGFATTVAELGIACEACHGPGAVHARANADPSRRYALHLAPRADPTIVNPARLPPARAADICGRCHGQRITGDVGPFLAHGDPFVAGDDLGRYSAPLRRDTALHGDAAAFSARFWPDGTARLTAYEYQGLLQSACARKGALTCTSCHGMHEGDPRGQIRARFPGKGNQMCTQCHAPLAAPAALARHARHDPAGEGGSCVACHMPRIVYGVLDIHRSHRIEVPRAGGVGPSQGPTVDRVGERGVSPREPVAGGVGPSQGPTVATRPDACTLCHVVGVAGRGAPPMDTIFTADPVGRAVAADALGRAPVLAADERARRVGALLADMESDAYPAVRHVAWRSLRRLIAPGAAAGTGLAAAFDPSGDVRDRMAAVAALRRGLGPAAGAADPRAVAVLARASPDQAVEIGE
jgi:predicted CXXCH cytochrome family protein